MEQESLTEEIERMTELFKCDSLPLSPEQRLMVAIIDRAIRDSRCSAPHLRIDAIRWLRSREITPYSFRWCTEHLGINFYRSEDVIKNGRDLNLYRT